MLRALDFAGCLGSEHLSNKNFLHLPTHQCATQALSAFCVVLPLHPCASKVETSLITETPIVPCGVFQSFCVSPCLQDSMVITCHCVQSWVGTSFKGCFSNNLVDTNFHEDSKHDLGFFITTLFWEVLCMQAVMRAWILCIPQWFAVQLWQRMIESHKIA